MGWTGCKALVQADYRRIRRIGTRIAARSHLPSLFSPCHPGLVPGPRPAPDTDPGATGTAPARLPWAPEQVRGDNRGAATVSPIAAEPAPKVKPDSNGTSPGMTIGRALAGSRKRAGFAQWPLSVMAGLVPLLSGLVGWIGCKALVQKGYRPIRRIGTRIAARPHLPSLSPPFVTPDLFRGPALPRTPIRGPQAPLSPGFPGPRNKSGVTTGGRQRSRSWARSAPRRLNRTAMDLFRPSMGRAKHGPSFDTPACGGLLRMRGFF